ncbi:bifunctional pyr operon transcriptional regulator/uracil phosphoribosyltransferase PyrR [Mycoplasmatota bacterium]|nr:bifunctional pyr operon transcriptional regulator/uracil phosphoribosyltransferase PyrR [Mycoplasmatota bacterium]
MNDLKLIIDASTLSRSLKRMAHEILEKNKGTDDLVIIGIKNKGTVIAKRICDNINQIEGVQLPIGELDITAYRDDFAKKDINTSTIDFSVENKKVILVDDVLYTGRSVRAALDAILSYGRPKEIQLATLIDRGHRELPIRSDYVGKNIPTANSELVIVSLQENDLEDGVYIKKL